MRNVKGQVESFGLEIPGAPALIKKYAKSTGGEFECVRIVGRKFEDVNDHARYVAEGGCSKIIEILAAPAS
jgi:hypothetical protein